MSEQLNPLLYTDKLCGVCDGDGKWYLDGQLQTCECCGGSGHKLTEIGSAIWGLAQKAAIEAIGQQHE